METNYVSRDRYGMYAGGNGHGAGPALMGADTLLGTDVYNTSEEELGDINRLLKKSAYRAEYG